MERRNNHNLTVKSIDVLFNRIIRQGHHTWNDLDVSSKLHKIEDLDFQREVIKSSSAVVCELFPENTAGYRLVKNSVNRSNVRDVVFEALPPDSSYVYAMLERDLNGHDLSMIFFPQVSHGLLIDLVGDLEAWCPMIFPRGSYNGWLNNRHVQLPLECLGRKFKDQQKSQSGVFKKEYVHSGQSIYFLTNFSAFPGHPLPKLLIKSDQFRGNKAIVHQQAEGLVVYSTMSLAELGISGRQPRQEETIDDDSLDTGIIDLVDEPEEDFEDLEEIVAGSPVNEAYLSRLKKEIQTVVGVAKRYQCFVDSGEKESLKKRFDLAKNEPPSLEDRISELEVSFGVRYNEAIKVIQTFNAAPDEDTKKIFIDVVNPAYSGLFEAVETARKEHDTNYAAFNRERSFVVALKESPLEHEIPVFIFGSESESNYVVSAALPIKRQEDYALDLERDVVSFVHSTVMSVFPDLHRLELEEYHGMVCFNYVVSKQDFESHQVNALQSKLKASLTKRLEEQPFFYLGRVGLDVVSTESIRSEECAAFHEYKEPTVEEAVAKFIRLGVFKDEGVLKITSDGMERLNLIFKTSATSSGVVQVQPILDGDTSSGVNHVQAPLECNLECNLSEYQASLRARETIPKEEHEQAYQHARNKLLSRKFVLPKNPADFISAKTSRAYQAAMVLDEILSTDKPHESFSVGQIFPIYKQRTGYSNDNLGQILIQLIEAGYVGKRSRGVYFLKVGGNDEHT